MLDSYSHTIPSQFKQAESEHHEEARSSFSSTTAPSFLVLAPLATTAFFLSKAEVRRSITLFVALFDFLLQGT